MADVTSVFGNMSLPERILTVMDGMVIDLKGMSDILNAEGERQHLDADILEALESLRREGQVCCRNITAEKEGCEGTPVYWSAQHYHGTSCLARKTPVLSQSTKTPTLRRTPCTTPKSSGLRSRTLGRGSTPSSQFVSPVMKRSNSEETMDYEQTPKRMKYSGGIREQRKCRGSGGIGVRTKSCHDDHAEALVLQNPGRLAWECGDGKMEKDTSRNNFLHNGYEDNPGDKIGRNLEQEKRKLLRDIQAKEECLRKLNMVRKYRTKNNLDELQVLIDKWRRVSQEAAERLLESTACEARPNMAQLLTHLQIDHKLIQYSAEDEDFY